MTFSVMSMRGPGEDDLLQDQVVLLAVEDLLDRPCWRARRPRRVPRCGAGSGPPGTRGACAGGRGPARRGRAGGGRCSASDSVGASFSQLVGGGLEPGCPGRSARFSRLLNSVSSLLCAAFAGVGLAQHAFAVDVADLQLLCRAAPRLPPANRAAAASVLDGEALHQKAVPIWNWKRWILSLRCTLRTGAPQLIFSGPTGEIQLQPDAGRRAQRIDGDLFVLAPDVAGVGEGERCAACGRCRCREPAYRARCSG